MRKTLWWVLSIVLLLAPLAADIEVKSPNGGETMALGAKWPIAWTAARITQQVQIVLIKGEGGKFGVIKESLDPGASPWEWTVGQTDRGPAPAGQYKIRVVTLDGSKGDVSDASFAIGGAVPPTIRKFPDFPRPVPLPLGKPRLEVTAISLACNASGYSIIFGYRNAGDAALPRRSELPVRPDYRVLIDGREVDKGDLFIPQSPPAAPGWELATHSGGFINFPVYEPRPWHIGTEITIILNERNVLNMGTASKTSSLQPIVLTCGYDLAFGGPVSIDWNANKARVVITKVGSSPELSKKISLVYTLGYYHTNTVSGGPMEATVTYPEGPYTISRSMEFPSTGPFPVRLDIPMEDSSYYDLELTIWPERRDEFDERNNAIPRARFERPGIPAGPRIHAIAFSTRADSRGTPTQLRTVISLLNEAGHSVGGLRLVLKRDGSTAEEWKGISLSAGQKQLYINYGPLPGPPLYNDSFQVYLYDSRGSLLDARSAIE